MSTGSHRWGGLSWIGGYLSNVRFVLNGYYHEWVAHFWSLAVEEQFYLIWPALILFTPRQMLAPAILLAIAVGPAYRLASQVFAFSGLACEILLPACLDTLGTGALVALLLHQPGDWLAQRRFYVLTGWGGLVVYSGIAVLQCVGRGGVVGFVAADLALAAAAAGLVAHTAYGCSGWARSILEFRPLIYVGVISYGLYVFHEIVNGIVQPLLHQSALGKVTGLAAGLQLAVTFLVAALSWRFFERPINNLKRLFPSEPQPDTSAEAANLNP
jgi:peptidoglycan/LPS O-acetylase OafA/YrhL